jgi:hypothetical protein
MLEGEGNELAAERESTANGSDKGGARPTDETREHVTLADDESREDDIVIGDDEDEHEEESGDDEGREEGEGDRPRGKSRSARRAERIRRLEVRNRELEDALRSSGRSVAATDDDKDLVEPKESDYPNDYFAYQRALQSYETRKAVREENRRVAQAQESERAERANREALARFNDRLDAVKDRIPDYDRVMKEASRIEIRDDVLGLMLRDPKGPLLAYHLAKNPDKVDALNRMSPIEAAREIGSLSARIRGPQPKKATDAKTKPRTPPKGGSSPGRKAYSDMSMDEYVKARAEELKAS